MKRILPILLGFISFAAILAAGPISYTVTVDSSSIGSSPAGFIEFQFNQANANTSLAATATVSDFTSAGFTFNNTTNSSLGGVTGSLSAPPLVFDNTVGGTNLHDQGVSTFGSSFSFTLTLDGAALGTPATDGSQFFVYLLGTDYSNLIGPAGGVAGVTINGDTTLTTNAVEGISSVSETPEPSTVAMFGLGIAMLAIRRRVVAG